MKPPAPADPGPSLEPVGDADPQPAMEPAFADTEPQDAPASSEEDASDSIDLDKVFANLGGSSDNKD